MAKEDKKDFNAMLRDSKDMPKFQTITDERSIEKYGGSRMYFAPLLKSVVQVWYTAIAARKKPSILDDATSKIKSFWCMTRAGIEPTLTA